ncbi:MAG: hypothetical protein F6K19_28230 [Cyanothece sp. SIO1E1]|nr:hypothetical protein [Cyanothece sp. SIO1E1]
MQLQTKESPPSDGKIRTSKNPPGQLTQHDSRTIRSLLHAIGIPANSNILPYYLTREILGETSPEWKAIETHYRGKEQDFCHILDGTSQGQLTKVLYDSASTTHITPLLATIKKLTGQQFEVAPPPDFKNANRDRERLLAAIRRKLIAGKAIQVGVQNDLWRTSNWALLRPELPKKEQLLIQETKSNHPFTELSILWNYKGRGLASIPIGRAIIHGQLYSLVIDGQPFTWTGAECTIGRKTLRLAMLSPKLKAQITTMVDSYIQTPSREVAA